MKTLRGIPLNIPGRMIGRVTTKRQVLNWGKEDVLLMENNPKGCHGYKAFLTTWNPTISPSRTRTPQVVGLSSQDVHNLHDGDIVLIDADGLVQRIWDTGSTANVVMVTNTCNCRCIMCPQPICRDDEDHLQINIRMLELANPRDVSHIVFTGGEPTLNADGLGVLLRLCKKRFPSTLISLLTNGRKLSDMEIAKAIASVEHPGLTYCIALHSDVNRIHDHVVGATGGFVETVRGLHNLALLRQQVEVRVVLMRDNYLRLPELAEFIYRNFPFVGHIAFMGMETTGLACNNIEEIWIDPVDYSEQLTRAVHHLRQREMNVSIYNLPLCLLPEKLWEFARDSISDWKKTYLPQCVDCTLQSRCPGVFATSTTHSPNIRAIE